MQFGTLFGDEIRSGKPDLLRNGKWRHFGVVIFFLVAFLPIYVNFRQTRRCYIVSGAQQVAPLAQLVRATDS